MVSVEVICWRHWYPLELSAEGIGICWGFLYPLRVLAFAKILTNCILNLSATCWCKAIPWGIQTRSLNFILLEEESCQQMICLMKEKLNKPEYTTTMATDFSQSSPVDRIVSSVMMMFSFNEYFEYRGYLTERLLWSSRRSATLQVCPELQKAFKLAQAHL